MAASRSDCADVSTSAYSVHESLVWHVACLTLYATLHVIRRDQRRSGRRQPYLGEEIPGLVLREEPCAVKRRAPVVVRLIAIGTGAN